MSREMWWCIHVDELRIMLAEVAAGAHPDTVLLEHYANAEHEPIEGDPT